MNKTSPSLVIILIGTLVWWVIWIYSLPPLPEKLKPEEAGILAYVRYPMSHVRQNVFIRNEVCFESSADGRFWIKESCVTK